MHKNAKMQMHFRVLRQSFSGKFKLSVGSGSQVSQLLECMISNPFHFSAIDFILYLCTSSIQLFTIILFYEQCSYYTTIFILNLLSSITFCKLFPQNLCENVTRTAHWSPSATPSINVIGYFCDLARLHIALHCIGSFVSRICVDVRLFSHLGNSAISVSTIPRYRRPPNYTPGENCSSQVESVLCHNITRIFWCHFPTQISRIVAT